MSLNLNPIRDAIKQQLADNISREINIYKYRTPHVPPCITQEITDITYFESFGPNGYARILFDLKVWLVHADMDDAEAAMDAYMSVGSGNISSIVDALHASTPSFTLNGIVDSCKCLEVGAPTVEANALVTTFQVEIYTRKAGANA